MRQEQTSDICIRNISGFRKAVESKIPNRKRDWQGKSEVVDIKRFKSKVNIQCGI